MEFLDNKTPKYELDNINVLFLAGMSTNKAELVKVNGFGTMASNDEAVNNFTLFDLHMFHTISKMTWNYMSISCHLVTLFAMLYIHLPDGPNKDLILSHLKDKNMRLFVFTRL